MTLRRTLAAGAIAALLLAGCAGAPPLAFLGSPAPPAAAERAVVIGPQTRWVNVTGGETVRFEVGAKSFAWRFDSALNVSSFDLRRIAPPGLLDHDVRAYVAPNPLYTGDGERDS